jgi:hypothetical protein
LISFRIFIKKGNIKISGSSAPHILGAKLSQRQTFNLFCFAAVFIFILSISHWLFWDGIYTLTHFLVWDATQRAQSKLCFALKKRSFLPSIIFPNSFIYLILSL